MANTLFDRTIAFAGICQSVKLVQEIARKGSCDYDALSASLNSIILTNPSSTLEVFGNEENLTIGLNTLINELDNSPGGSELTRYLINLLALERKLSGRRDSLAQLSDRIETVQRQVQHFELLDDQMISNLASIYLDTISPLGPRIQVTGNPAQLQQTGVQHKVRALLLAGIRGTVLWRQVGGKRRHLIFGRKQMIEQAKIILARNS
ncbi:high frequency lysogenization protein HflD [Grimontia sp. NTOU-MAR1]|uniref:high frequency lysogenization protein HflD n=1 Tax=Grimontia sp. NTOU-MAR1 TaxID=3111011 RepID=UPI002DBE37F6|nr:high frequency lysogenization protein HflD [Grimontia sp. NTOU-MAR1]WRV98921.1 high frequency lysogenization protein HflD [Grimontia sp. NTOU-MAR1]